MELTYSDKELVHYAFIDANCSNDHRLVKLAEFGLELISFLSTNSEFLSFIDEYYELSPEEQLKAVIDHAHTQESLNSRLRQKINSLERSLVSSNDKISNLIKERELLNSKLNIWSALRGD